MIDAHSEERLKQVHPTLALKIRMLIAQLAGMGIECRVVQGLRTIAEQDALYAQGRTTPGKIVTNARGGQSFHNLALACDVIPGVRGAETWTPNWNSEHADYRTMGMVGESLGLVWGGRWIHLPDKPHFQMNGILPENAPTAQAVTIARTEGLPAAWKFAGLEVHV
jgi:peptidoglycan L-alanyl-D-glutamate endopeptidase CwlK